MKSGRAQLRAGQLLPQPVVCGARGSLGLFFSVGVCVQGAEEGQLTSLSDLGPRFCGSPWAGQVVGGHGLCLCKLCVSPSPPPDFVLRDFLLSENLFPSETGLTAVAFPSHLFL